jgi:hypothetical protein
MIIDFFKNFWNVIKYIPSGTWKLVFTIHLCIAIPAASGITQNGMYSAGQAILLAAIWYAVIIWPIIIIYYWRLYFSDQETIED